MALVVDQNSVLRVAQTLELSGQQVTVVHELAGPSGQLNASTTPAPSKVAKGSVVVNGTVELDLTDLDGLVVEGTTLTVDMTGERVIAAKFKTPSGAQPAITIEPGDTNPFPIGTRVIESNSSDLQQRPNSTAVVGPTAKTIKLSSSAAATLEFEVVSAG